MLTIDGSGLDKHGRILWLALSVSSLSRIPFRMERIRISQNPPGLLPEHLPFIHAFEVLMNAEVKGAHLQSTELVFEPHSLRRGHLEIALGKGHPITPFVLATMPVLLRTLAPLSLSITGATHHPSFPCIESVAGSFIPLLLQAGARIECEVAELGFAPHGEGRLKLQVEPSTLGYVEIEERGKLKRRMVQSLGAGLPPGVGDRCLRLAKQRLALSRNESERIEVAESAGSGHALVIKLDFEHIHAVFTGYSERGSSHETASERAIGRALHYLESEGAIPQELAPFFLLIIISAQGGSFTTSEPDATLNDMLECIKWFLKESISANTFDERKWTISVHHALI